MYKSELAEFDSVSVPATSSRRCRYLIVLSWVSAPLPARTVVPVPVIVPERQSSWFSVNVPAPSSVPPVSSRLAMPVAAPAKSVPPLSRSAPAPVKVLACSTVIRPEFICTVPGPASAKLPLIRLLAAPSAVRNSVVPSAMAMRPPAADVSAAMPLLEPL